MADDSKKIKILLTGGGSGGHVQPLLAIADALRELVPNVKLHFVGVRKGLEATIVPRNNIPIHFAPSTGMPGNPLSLKMLRFLVTLIAGIAKATLLLFVIRPHAIIASGGFASAPSVFAAKLLGMFTFGFWRIPIYMHEQNAVPGRMNQFAGRFVDRIGVSHPSAVKGFNHRAVEVVGYPVRSSFAKISREEARRELKLSDNDFYILVTGGSQGARTINRAIIDALPFLKNIPNLKIIHASGTMKSGGYNAAKDSQERLKKTEGVPEGYKMVDYLHDLPLHLAASDMAVIRAGAGSLVEVCNAAIPAIVVPKANLPGDSQVANARDVASQGAIELVYEEPTLINGKMIESVPGKALANRIIKLMQDADRRKKLSEAAKQVNDGNAAMRVARRVLRMARSLTSLDADDPFILPLPLFEDSNGIATLPSGATGIRRFVERTLHVSFESAFAHGRIKDSELKKLPDLDYLRYRGAALLVHSNWSLRNEGVKLIGLTRNEKQRAQLAHIITDRTPAPASHRMLGGDFYHVGFVRRNALSALAFIGTVDDTLRETIRYALNDPYYEVRVYALRLIRAFKSQGLKLDVAMVASIITLTEDSRLEVVWEALHTLGYVGSPKDILDTYKRFALANHPPVREAVLKGYHALLDRYADKKTPWKKELINDLDRFAITSVSFHPHFPLKEQYAALQNRLKEGDDE